MNKQKGFVKILLIIIAIIVVAVFAYIQMGSRTEIIPSNVTDNENSSSFQNSEKEITAEWEIYRNDKYGFEMKYPNGFVVSKQTDDSLYLANNQSCVEKIKVSSPGYVEDGCLHLGIIIQDNKIIYEGWGITRETIKISGLDGEKIIDQDNKQGDEDSNITVQFKKENKWYIFYIINNKNDNKTASNLLNQVLASFKFTK